MENLVLKSLKRKRGSIKSRLTSFSNHVESLQNRDLTEVEVLEIEQRLKRIDELLTEFDVCHNGILEIIDEDDIEDAENYRTEFEELYFKISARARQMVDKFRGVSQHEINNSNAVSTSGSNNGSMGITKNNVKLPVMKLPEFDGSYEKWLAFHDTFKSLIHSNDNMSAVQKFHYLSSSLVGEAAEVIRGLEISEINYSAAWELLQRRYLNKPLMIHNHIKGIVEHPKLTRQGYSLLRDFLNSILGHMRALEALEQQVGSWNNLLMYIITEKLDSNTKREWVKQQIGNDEMPEVSALIEFLENQCQLLQKIDKQTKDSEQHRSSNFGRQLNKTSFSHTVTKQQACPNCKEQHALFLCKTFLDLPVSSRIDEVKRLRRCLNCLRPGHISSQCRSQKCRKCQKPHNTLLHMDVSTDRKVDNKLEITKDSDTVNNSVKSTVINHSRHDSNTSHVLPTARVQIMDSNGNAHNCIALLDSGSQSNFLSTDLCKRLGLKSSRISFNVVGVNQSQSNITETTYATIKSHASNLVVTLSFLLIRKITSNLPSEPLDLNRLHIPDNIVLADPEFHRSKNIDMLIGVDLFWDLLYPESSLLPYLHKTKFGYVVSGRIPCVKQNKGHTACNVMTINDDLSLRLKRFWELEESPTQEMLSAEEEACELSFTQTTKRNAEGRFIVTIPLKGSLNSLGESKEQAERRFLALERKLQRNEILKTKYIEFMQQYEQLGHMTKVEEEMNPPIAFYLPHHGVLKAESITTKLRVVFDGSATSTTGVSINDLHMVGPTMQKDLLTIILRFRVHPFVVGADISMMYRQILIVPEQRALQRILWRSTPSDPLQTYELNTVTYGLASSSYLAIRSLMQLSKDNETLYPRAAEIIRNCMYVDDLLYGASAIEEAIQIREEVSCILACGGFQLRKWISNEPNILNNFDTKEEVLPYHVIKLGENECVKTLGLSWSSTNDNLIYDVSIKLDSQAYSKRSILSTIARIHDPLGLLSPCIIIAKIILQKLWLEKLSWDDTLSPETSRSWTKFINDFASMKKMEICRHVCCKSPSFVEIHAFSDASESAYGAAIYIRSIDTLGTVSVKLLCSKSKVAPLKPVTIPRLELCAAQISARLMEKVKNSLDIKIDKIYYWCDSTIVLSWLNLEPNKLKTFVSNRVFEIQSLSNSDDWHHVASQDNPADLVSRGVYPTALRSSVLWWEGPAWLSYPELPISVSSETVIDVPELKTINKTTALSHFDHSIIRFEDHSDLNRLERIIAYCLRFINNCKKHKDERIFGNIILREINDAMILLIKLSQRQTFHEEINCLTKGRELPTKSKILNLNPFIHTDGVLRVGGRLQHSHYNFNKQHPMIISNHHLTKLIFAREHQRLLHAGPQTLLSCLRDVYWPIAGRNLARKTVHNCLKCFRANPREISPLMGNLPRDRITPTQPFSVTGVDYAGPFAIKDRKGRGGRISKCYVAVFVCFATRAIHLELVTDLTTDCFVLALRRFVSRWGMPIKIHSDNGTNFVGARSQLKDLGRFLRESEKSLNAAFIKERFSWHFIPAYSPHFGGIWEAGVKSTKYHLKRVMGDMSLTFEEFYSLLAQVSAILNSRPLTPMSSNPSDLQPLTPAHFLIGRSLTSVPDPSLVHLPESHMSRYQRIQHIQQHFWLRWSKEYISELQTRIKWKRNQGTLRVGTLVLIKDDNLPPMKWKLGRVTNLHPGSDSIVRVVSLRTSQGIVRRAIRRVCPLPIDTSDDQ